MGIWGRENEGHGVSIWILAKALLVEKFLKKRLEIWPKQPQTSSSSEPLRLGRVQSRCTPSIPIIQHHNSRENMIRNFPSQQVCLLSLLSTVDMFFPPLKDVGTRRRPAEMACCMSKRHNWFAERQDKIWEIFTNQPTLGVDADFHASFVCGKLSSTSFVWQLLPQRHGNGAESSRCFSISSF